ncbi:MAG: hypothetical protein ACOYD0_00745 [Candidatus Nanopelagicales bacterium]
MTQDRKHLVRSLVSFILITVGAGGILYFRIPPSARAVLYAEDGRDFIQGILDRGLGSLFDPVGGYLHVVPRLLAGLVTLLPPEMWANAVTVVACLVAGAICAGVFVASAPLIPDPWLRLLLAVVPIFVPAMGHEIAGLLNNLHWFMLWLVPWLLFNNPRTRAGRVGLAILLLAAATMEPQIVIYAPLAAWRWREAKGIRLPIVAAGVGLTMQALTYALNATARGDAAYEPSVGGLARGFVGSVLDPLWVDSVATSSSLSSVLVIAALSAVPVFAAGAVIFVKGTPPVKIMATALILGAVATFSASFWLNYGVWADLAFVDDRMAPGFDPLIRYSVLPAAMLISLIPLALQVAVTRVGWRPSTVIAAALAAALIVVVPAITSFHVRSLRLPAAEFDHSVRKAKPQCRDSSESVRVSIAPVPKIKGASGNVWAVDIPCDRLVSR